MDFIRILIANRKGFLGGCVLLLFCFIVGGTAAAQQLERENTVTDRARPGLDADGIPLGAFRFFPSAGLGLMHNDNVFATSEFEQSDLVVVVQPALKLTSESSRHRATLAAEGDLGRFRDFDGEDYDDFDIYAEGGVDVGNGRVRGELRHSEKHEERTSVDDARGVEPTEYTIDKIAGTYSWKPGRWMAKLDAGYRKMEFDSTVTLTTPIDNADRDRNTTQLGFRLAREVSPSYALYGEVQGKQIEYEQQFDGDGFERSSDDFSAVFGAVLDFSGQTFGEVFAGYLSRDFDDARYSTADGPTFGGRVTWNVTGLTTLEFTGSRRIDSTTIIGASGINTTEFGFQADHELLRSLVLNLDLSMANEDFEGIDRDDDLKRFLVGGKYFMNRYMNLEFGYVFRDREISPASSGGREFEMSQYFVRVVGQL